MVIVTCSGKFHAFNLAEQLNRHQLLHSFYTPYAYQKNVNWRKLAKRIDKEEIPPEKIKTLIPWAIGRKLWNQPWFWNELFDRWVATQLRYSKGCTVFVGWSGMSLHSLRVAKAKGIKTILTRGSAHIEVQNDLLHEEYSRMGINYVIPPKEVQKELQEYQLADYISVPSSFAQNSFLAKGFIDDKIFMNPLGVNLDLFKRVTPKNDKHEQSFKVVYLGNLSFQKGIVYLVEAVRLLKARGKKPEILFVGGPTPEILLWQKQQKWPDNCHLLGHIPQHQLSEVLSECQLGIAPSIQDGFAQVIPQMLAAGIPVITTTNTGGPEMITDGVNGYIIPIRDAPAIAQHIEQLMEQPDKLRIMMENSRPSVASGFTWEDYGQRHIEFINKIS